MPKQKLGAALQNNHQAPALLMELPVSFFSAFKIRLWMLLLACLGPNMQPIPRFVIISMASNPLSEKVRHTPSI
jgi:hypothetical protein